MRQRDEYVEGVEALLENLKSKAEQNRRNAFLTAGSKERLRGEFKAMLGYPLSDYKPDPCVSVRFDASAEYGEMKTTRCQLEVLPGFWFYGMLYEHIESVRSNKNALVIASHGGGGDPEVVGSLVRGSENYNHMVKRVLGKDVTVFAPQLLLWNREHCGGREYDRNSVDRRLRQFGGSVTGLEVYCVMRCVDYFAGRDWIDETRIGMVGLSYGGMYALYTAAADARIKSVLSSCWFNDRLKYNWPDWGYQNQAERFLDAEVASLVLPRKLYIEIADNDELFDHNCAVSDISRLHEYAKREGCEDSVRVIIFEGLHELDKSEDGIRFFLENLK